MLFILVYAQLLEHLGWVEDILGDLWQEMQLTSRNIPNPMSTLMPTKESLPPNQALILVPKDQQEIYCTISLSSLEICEREQSMRGISLSVQLLEWP